MFKNFREVLDKKLQFSEEHTKICLKLNKDWERKKKF